MSGSIRLPEFDVETTLLGGQAFRWEKEVVDGTTSFSGIIKEHFIQVKIETSIPFIFWLSAAGNLKTCIFEYFDLNRDYQSATQTLFLDPEFSRFLSVLGPHQQPRILRQPWFETLISFIVSANNNIPRIRNSIKVISRLYGKKIEMGKDSGFAFPTPESLAKANRESLREKCNVGYRDAYILKTSEIVRDQFSFWEAHEERSTEDLRSTLRELPGVGPKVAECVLLFGFHRWEAFPVDTWIRKAVHQAFPQTVGYSDRDISLFGRDRFGPLAGFAQQLLFESARKRASV